MKKLFLFSTAFIFALSLTIITGNRAYSQNNPQKDNTNQIQKDRQNNKKDPKHTNNEKKNIHKKSGKSKTHPHKTTHTPAPAKKPNE